MERPTSGGFPTEKVPILGYRKLVKVRDEWALVIPSNWLVEFGIRRDGYPPQVAIDYDGKNIMFLRIKERW